MAVFALLVHPTRPEAAERAEELAEWLVTQGHDVFVPAEASNSDGLERYEADNALIAGRADLGVSLGGDGSMLRAVHLLADGGVPVLGMNFGNLGYLTQVEPGDATTAIERWLAGDFSIETRMRVGVSMPDGTVATALNEIVIEKTDSGRTVRVTVSIDQQRFHTYETDGIIVASPTGSTAYSLSARGPLMEPTHEALILTPVAPHTLFDRSMVLSPTAEVGLMVEGDRPAHIAVDGRVMGRLEPGEAACCTAAAEPARLVTFGDRNFHSIIKTKFGLNSR